ncbi:MAG: PUA domain-containing protein [Candidatus Asgardarchaeia archaeon]
MSFSDDDVLKEDFSDAVVEALRSAYPNSFHSLLMEIKRPSKRFYLRVNTLKSSTDEVLNLLNERGYEFRRDDALDYAIYTLTEGPFKIEMKGKRVYADKNAAESVMIGSNLYSKGILKVEKVKKGDTVSVFSPRGDLVGIGEALMDWNEMLKRKGGIAVETFESVYKTPKVSEMREYKEGYVYSQSLPSIVSVEVLDPRPGELVVDVCAAPGGKTSAVAQKMMNKGTIIAIDRSANRARVMSENLERMGVSNVKVFVMDVTKVRPPSRGFADRVLVDPPCSNLGVRPKLYDLKKEKVMKSYTPYQKKILDFADSVLKEGGILLYTTCTLTLNENEENVKYMLYEKNYEGVEIEKRIRKLADPPLIKDFEKFCMRFSPHLRDTPGYFIALLEKSG